ncbi:MAG: hypothetical protein HUK14_05375 [Muribaculaceae bacterium]|nr:hypothetical protein [Muribaculaceae bacterium]
MSTTPRRILLLGDASNCHNTLATGLRRLGHDVTVASSGSSFMNTHRDIDLRRPLPGKAGGLLLYLRAQRLMPKARDYDIVAIFDTLFINLKPHRCKKLFCSLLKHNANVFLTFMSTNSFLVKDLTGTDSPFRYSEWMVNGKPTPYRLSAQQTLKEWLADDMQDLCTYIYNNVKGVASVLYEYYVSSRRHLPADKIGYIGIPIDTAAIGFTPPPADLKCVKILLGRHSKRMLEKGTDLFETAAKAIIARHPGKATLQIVEDLPYNDYLKIMAQSDLVLDQIFSYTPATNALLAMAMGKTVVSGAEPEYYDFIGERDNRPIINVFPDYTSIEKAIEDVILRPGDFAERGRRSREFVEKHNDAVVVAQRAMDFWTKRL